MDCVDILKAIKVGPCGGDGGEPFSLDNITRIVKIGVYYSTYIHAITITYIVDGNQKSVTFGGPGGDSAEVPPFCISILIDFNFVSEQCEVLSLGNAN